MNLKDLSSVVSNDCCVSGCGQIEEDVGLQRFHCTAYTNCTYHLVCTTNNCTVFVHILCTSSLDQSIWILIRILIMWPLLKALHCLPSTANTAFLSISF